MKKTDRKKGFSLAEGMVMLVIVSILMALAAPLIVKRSQADSRTLWLTSDNGSVVNGGMGRNQKVGIGQDTNHLNDPFVKVQINRDRADMGYLSVGPRPVGAGAQNTGLHVNRQGQVNILSCVPNWDDTKAYTVQNPGNAVASDGYLAINSQCVFVNNHIFCPSINVTEINFDAKTITRQYTGDHILIPVRQGNSAIPAVGLANLPVTLSADSNPVADDFFIPCAQGYKVYNITDDPNP